MLHGSGGWFYFAIVQGYEQIMERPIILHKSRVDLATEFIANMRNHKLSERSGVLISGPSGVGKSSVGLLTVLACSAARLPVVYVSSGIAWVSAAESGNGDAHLLNLFVNQNADIIVASDVLSPVFSAYFRGEEELGPATMQRLESALQRHSNFAVGVIVDEVQAITAVVETPTEGEKKRKYFTSNWYNWQGRLGSLFVRMDIASSHGIIQTLHILCFL
jgi:hypothetical protein